MPSSNVGIAGPFPLTRFNTLFPGQFGVNGTANETGLRTDSNGAVFYVDPNFPGVSDLRDGTDPTSPLATVGAALALCSPYANDTIYVMGNNSWQYGDPLDGRTTAIAEEVTIDVPGVRLVGVCPAGGMGVYWTPASDGGTCITVHAIDCLIEGFSFGEGATWTGCNAIASEWDGTTLFGENLTVRNCYFDDTVDAAISLEYSWYCDIHHNVFSQCDTYGIYIDVAGSGAAYCTIHDNLFQDCGTAAISLLGGCDDNWIYNNAIFNRSAQTGAAATNEGINTTGGTRNMVFGNYFSCLLPVPANGDYSDLNSSSATDAWINNHCLDGPSTTSP